MYSKQQQRAETLSSTLPPEVLAGRKIGLEKESLRVSASGLISQTDHPRELGAALTHPYITTDFSEALLEMVTPPCDSAEDAIDFLTGIHQFIIARLPDREHLWNTSMPCILRGGESVRIGEYGHSHNGKMKHAYRRGLGLRYGRRMQAIAGVHFNFSLPMEFWSYRQSLFAGDLTPLKTLHTEADDRALQAITDGYFSMTQNLIRVGWIVPYLFGASPAICSSFLHEGEGEEFETWNQTTRFAPYGTSLRMGKIGYRYRDDEPIDLSVNHHDLRTYIEDIIGHVGSVHPPYEKLGLQDENGDFQQLSCSRLQIENEFYSTVRPKQIPAANELPIHALKSKGIRYLELRSIDVNVLDPVGVSLSQIAMLELLMLFAWLSEPKPLSADEMQASKDNIQLVAHNGRQPGLKLQYEHQKVDLVQWGEALLDVLEPIAVWLDSNRSTPIYLDSVRLQRAKLHDPSLTPSAKMLSGVQQAGSFFEYTQDHSLAQVEWLKKQPENAELQAQLLDQVDASLHRQSEMESNSQGSFEEFLARYLGQIHAG